MVVMSVPEEELTEELYKLLLFISLAGLIAIVLAILIIYFLSRSISNPINRLVTHIQAIAAGNLQNTLHYPWRDEIGQLFSGVAAMQTQLADRIAENKLVMDKALRMLPPSPMSFVPFSKLPARRCRAISANGLI